MTLPAGIDALLRLIGSDDDQEALMGLRSLQALVRQHGVGFEDVIATVVAGLPALAARLSQDVADTQTTSLGTHTMPAPAPGHLPLICRAQAGVLEIQGEGDGAPITVNLPSAAAASAQAVAESLKDALVAASINKCRMKLKLHDVKNGRGEVLESALRAEYERPGMTPVTVWVAARGDVAALAAVLRPALTQAMPGILF